MYKPTQEFKNSTLPELNSSVTMTVNMYDLFTSVDRIPSAVRPEREALSSGARNGARVTRKVTVDRRPWRAAACSGGRACNKIVDTISEKKNKKQQVNIQGIGDKNETIEIESTVLNLQAAHT